MKKGRTQSGFDYEIKDENLNDMRVVDALVDLDGCEDGSAIVTMSQVATLLLGKEQKNALYNHIAEINGKVTMEKFVVEMSDILGSEEAKK